MNPKEAHRTFRQDSLRARWKSLKRRSVDEVMMIDRELSVEVRHVLGSRIAHELQRLEREFDAYPDHDTDQIRRMADRLTTVVQAYGRQLGQLLAGDAPLTRSTIVRELDELLNEAHDRVDWYLAHPTPPLMHDHEVTLPPAPNLT